MADDRKTVAARVSPEAHDGGIKTSRVYEANATALAEVIGLELAQLEQPLGRLPKHWRKWLTAAARIEEEHRANQGKRKNR